MEVELVGLEGSSNGRSCTVHSVCGVSVQVGDVLRLVPCVVTIDHVTEPAVKCVKVVDGMDTCTVAFIPRVQSKLPQVQKHLNQFVQVVELYADSPSPYKRKKSYTNKGMARVSLLLSNDGRSE